MNWFSPSIIAGDDGATYCVRSSFEPMKPMPWAERPTKKRQEKPQREPQAGEIALAVWIS
jgi:hypothetical protein